MWPFVITCINRLRLLSRRHISVHLKKKKKRIKNILIKSSKKKHIKEFILSKAAGFLCKTKLDTTHTSFKDVVQICGRPFSQNIFNEMRATKKLLNLKSKVKNLCQSNLLLTNSLTTFSGLRLSVRSLGYFKSARELNLVGNIL